MDIYDIISEEILDRISRHCPEALSTYLQCSNLADDQGAAFFSHQKVERDMSLSWTKFRNNVKKLALENLLEWHEIDGGLLVRLAESHDEK